MEKENPEKSEKSLMLKAARTTAADVQKSDLPGMAEAREAIERASKEGAPVYRTRPEDVQRELRQAQIAPPASAAPVLTVAFRFRASGYIFDHMMPVVVKWLEESPDRIISVAEVIEGNEAWIVVTEQRELPDFYSPAHYARREAQSTK